ncbi:MAG TPA: DUF445 family protein [Bacillota bacterium]|nr:DUF445 family protein [Bacillota bacterium]
MLDITIMAIVGALIGWFTNYLAIKLIFRPYDPWRIPILGISIQGLIPKRRQELAVSIAKTVEEQLFSTEDIINRLVEGENKREIIWAIKYRILKVIRVRMPAIVPSAITDVIVKKIGAILDTELESLFDTMVEDALEKAVEKVNIEKIVEDKINSLDIRELEGLIIGIASRELKHIEVLGGVLGFMIGLFQGLILLVIR